MKREITIGEIENHRICADTHQVYIYLVGLATEAEDTVFQRGGETFSMVRYDTVWYAIILYVDGIVKCGMLWYGMVWLLYGVVWYGMLWCGMASVVVWCGVE